MSVLVMSCKTLIATTSELCTQSENSSCICPTCEFVPLETHKMCVKGDIICIPANYSRFDLPNQLNATTVKYIIIERAHLLDLPT